MYDDDLIGWQLDDVLGEFTVDFSATIDGIAIDSTGEPRNPLLDEGTRERLDLSDGPTVATFAGGKRCKRPTRLACDCGACKAWTADL